MASDRRHLPELLGWLGGWALAPWTAAGSLVRRARVLHPEGVCYEARGASAAASGLLSSVANRLQGDVLVRFSAALWRKGKEWPDVLGCAIRFRGQSPGSALDGEQDLLLATIPRPWLTPFGPLWTDPHDFLHNTYYAVAPFDVDGVGRVRWRIRPSRPASGGPDRASRLERAVVLQQARLSLDAWAVDLAPAYAPVVVLELHRPAEVDQQALRFSPFRNGLGITPRGFVHALRVGAYAGSQSTRPRSGR